MLDRLKQLGELAGIRKSRFAERYADERMRMDEHPGIVFRDGPTGRRAGLAGGPDVWELVAALNGGKSSGEEAVVPAAELLPNLTDSQVGAAVRYYDAFTEEIDQRIALNSAASDEAEAALRRGHSNRRCEGSTPIDR